MNVILFSPSPPVQAGAICVLINTPWLCGYWHEINEALEGDQTGLEVYACLKITPSEANLSRLNV